MEVFIKKNELKISHVFIGKNERFQNVHPVGFEPTTLGSEDRCSIQLSYRCEFLIPSILRLFKNPLNESYVTRLCNPMRLSLNIKAFEKSVDSLRGQVRSKVKSKEKAPSS